MLIVILKYYGIKLYVFIDLFGVFLHQIFKEFKKK